MGRVLLNLYTMHFYAVAEKMKLQSESYEPTVSLSTKKLKVYKFNSKLFLILLLLGSEDEHP